MAPGFSAHDLDLMANLTRIVIFGEILFIVGSFLSAILQSYNHFFIPGIASALYNLGIILGIVLLSPFLGIYSAAYGIVLGALIFVLAQVPMVKKMGFSFMPVLSLAWIKTSGVIDIFKAYLAKDNFDRDFSNRNVNYSHISLFFAKSRKKLCHF